MINTGGRKHFEAGEARILQLDGRISENVYIIRPDSRSDGSGYIEILKKDTGKTIKIHHRRILPLKSYGLAVAMGTGGKYRAVCPKCGILLTPSSDKVVCPDDGDFNLIWIGEKPMTTEKTVKTKTPRTPKAVQEPIKVDLDELAGLPDCELWSKSVKFDHPGVDVLAHVLLHVPGERKLCFNSYNSTLGKKSKPLPTDELLSGESETPAKNIFKVKDLAAERAKLVNNNYEQRTHGE